MAFRFESTSTFAGLPRAHYHFPFLIIPCLREVGENYTRSIESRFVRSRRIVKLELSKGFSTIFPSFETEVVLKTLGVLSGIRDLSSIDSISPVDKKKSKRRGNNSDEEENPRRGFVRKESRSVSVLIQASPVYFSSPRIRGEFHAFLPLR